MNPFEIVPILINKLEAAATGGISATFSGLFSATSVSTQDSPEYCTAELSGSDLFLGISDGSVAHYTLDPLLSDGCLEGKLQNRSIVSNLGHPCTCITAVPSEDKLLVQTGKLAD